MALLPRTARTALLGLCATLLLAAPQAQAQQQERLDAEYTRLIRETTTEPFFLTPLVDHLPASETVPTPLDFLGHIAGATDVLSYPEEIAAYMRAVAQASPRVRVFTIGQSEEGREMIMAIVGDEATIADLDGYKARINALSDPRATREAEAERLMATLKPMYYATGAIHSGETGSPEMLMELLYRLAVGESEHIRAIRDNLIVAMTPVVEVDGRAKQVDLHMAPRKDPDGNYPRRLLYWGRYVAHDNNRDGMSQSLALQRAVTGAFLEYKPIVLHDLHESASYLYTSTGRGPYNAWIDPIVISEWARLAHKEVKDMAAYGVPGVYTHDFYDGWAPNYMFWVANMRNAIGRFYETQSSGNASTRILRTNVDRHWSRPNTPLPEVVWNIRNNNNLQQSALLIAMREIADNRQEFLRSYWEKTKRSVAKARAEGPAAYVLPADDDRLGLQARLVDLMLRQGVEVHRLEESANVAGRSYGAGSYVIRMDQPYSRTADMLLDKQYYSPRDPSPYDDVGWTLGALYDTETARVEDPAVLERRMALVTQVPVPPGGVENAQGASAFVVDYDASNALTTFRYAHPDLRIEAAERDFSAAGMDFRAGSFVIPTSGNSGNLAATLDAAGKQYGFRAVGVSNAPSVATHPVRAPRVAVMHTWQSTQSEGWLRLGLDEYGVPYDYISVHEVRDNANLKDTYDVILFGPSSGNALSIVEGLGGSEPQPWQASEHAPNIGRQSSTPDMRGGLELTGVLNLANFVRQGGVLVTLTSSASLPTHFGMAGGLSIRSTNELWAPGGVYRTRKADGSSPLAYGYGGELGVYFNRGPVFSGGGGGGGRFGGGNDDPGSTTERLSGRGGVNEEDIIQGRPRDLGRAGVEAFAEAQRAEAERQGGGRGGPGGFGGGNATGNRVVFQFTPEQEELLISGGLTGGAELAGAPALVDAPYGDGHVVMFSFNPFWRSETLGAYGLVFNSLLHWDSLGAGRAVADEDAEQQREGAGM
ncbi:MAG: M14 family zinc carboxypeptidase [Gemmatimonadota bacterium]